MNKITFELLDEKFHIVSDNYKDAEDSFFELKKIINEIKLQHPKLTVNQLFFVSSMKIIEKNLHINKNNNFEENNNGLECKKTLDRIEYFLHSIINLIDIEEIEK